MRWSWTILVFAVFAIGSGCDSCSCDVKHVCRENLGDAGITNDVMTTAAEAHCVAPMTKEVPDPSCADEFEPNGDFVRAAVGSGYECTPTSKNGIIAGEGDVDVFRTGSCCVGACIGSASVATGKLRPWAELAAADAMTDVSGLRVCVFPTCSTGSTNVYACYETTANGKLNDTTSGDLYTSQLGFRGCCRTGAGRITAEFDCPRRLATFDTFFWVEAPNVGNQCYPYTLSYNVSD